MNYKKRPVSYKKRLIGTIVTIILIIVLLYFSSFIFPSTLSKIKGTSFLIRVVSNIVLLLGFYELDSIFDLSFKVRHYVYFTLIVATGLLLSPLYFVFPQYDKILHFIQPLLLSSIIFYLISLLKIDLKWRLIFTFFILIGMLGLLEVGEYLLDETLGWKLQGVYVYDSENFELIQSRLDDTVADLIIGGIGTLVYILSVALFFRKKAS